MRTNSRPVARAIDLPSEVLPTPGGPTRQRIGPVSLLARCCTARYSTMRSLTFSKPWWSLSRMFCAPSRSFLIFERLLAGFLRELGLLDLLLELGQLVARIVVAEFLLDGLHLLVQVVLALRLLHLALDARTDALLHLQDGDFAFHQAENLFQPLGGGGDLEDGLLVG